MAEWMDVRDDETGVWERAVVQKNGGKFFVTRWERYPAYGGEEVYEVRESAVPRFVGRKVKLQKLDKLIKGDTVWTVEGEIVVDQNDRINRCIMPQSGSTIQYEDVSLTAPAPESPPPRRRREACCTNTDILPEQTIPPVMTNPISSVSVLPTRNHQNHFVYVSSHIVLMLGMLVKWLDLEARVIRIETTEGGKDVISLKVTQDESATVKTSPSKIHHNQTPPFKSDKQMLELQQNAYADGTVSQVSNHIFLFTLLQLISSFLTKKAKRAGFVYPLNVLPTNLHFMLTSFPHDKFNTLDDILPPKWDVKLNCTTQRVEFVTFLKLTPNISKLQLNIQIAKSTLCVSDHIPGNYRERCTDIINNVNFN